MLYRKEIQTSNTLNDKVSVRVESTSGTVTLTPSKSGDFTVVLKAVRLGNDPVKESVVGELKGYVRPLDSFTITKDKYAVVNELELAWDKVSEATTYSVAYRKNAGELIEVATGLTTCEYTLKAEMTTNILFRLLS